MSEEQKKHEYEQARKFQENCCMPLHPHPTSPTAVVGSYGIPETLDGSEFKQPEK